MRKGMDAPLGDKRLKELTTADYAEIEELNQIASELLWHRTQGNANRAAVPTSAGRIMCAVHEWLDEKPCPYCAAVPVAPLSEDEAQFIPLPWEPEITPEIERQAEKRDAMPDTGPRVAWIATALALSMKLEEIMTKSITG